MEKSIELISSLGKIVVFLMLLFSVFLFTVKSNKKLANRLFAIFLLLTAFDFTGFFLGNLLSDHPDIKILKIASSLLQMPTFYLYVLATCYSDLKLKPKHLIHTLLFLGFLIVFKLTSISDQSFIIFTITGEIQYYVYIVLIFLSLRKYKAVYLENYSNYDNGIYRWLFQITAFFFFAHLFVLAKLGFIYFGQDQSFLQNIYLLISTIALFTICWFVLKALYSPQLFTGVKSDLEPIDILTERKGFIPNHKTIPNESTVRLISFMEQNKPHLDENLTLQKLAAQVDMPEKELSILINQQIGKHFFDFINEYRISDAKILLKDQPNLTVLEILYQVGFSSKSSFYTAFKKETGVTPSDYRRSNT
nr:AraC family transcriptional regulator [uncultured Chryseobacterium sp.]